MIKYGKKQKGSGSMENYIQQPLSNPYWDPKKGDFYSEEALAEERLYRRKEIMKKVSIGTLILLHLALMVYAIIYLA